MASVISKVKTLFFRKRKAPLACTMSLDPDHVHTDACFLEIKPLSVVELYQSQGCESCPPAVPNIHKALGSNPNALLLTYNVTYWDGRSDWKDTHGNSAWDARQRAYVTKWGRSGIFTPQIIIDGIADGTGRQDGEVTDVLSKAIESRNSMEWSVGIEVVSPTELRIASETGETESYDVILITYDPRPDNVKIGKGPNKRKKLEHINIVKDLVKIEEWAGGVQQVPVPENSDAKLQRVAILQKGQGGPIVAATKL